MPDSASHRNALAHGSMLMWYTVETVLGQGAFGITYLAEDTNLHRWIAIKEFLPGQLARRRADDTVEAINDELTDDFTIGRQRFMDEARTLARFEHPSIVRVHNVFEANGTAYMVMQYEEGQGLDEMLKLRGTLGEQELLLILPALLHGLAAMHAEGFLHRDIKPANIFIRHDGTPVLLDFGSARQANTGDARTLTSFVSPGYAPIEQYAGKSENQGPWSDIYGLGATLYRAMTGNPPVDAVERSLNLAQQAQDSYVSPATVQPYSAPFIAAVDCALRFRAADRPQTIASWRSMFPEAAPVTGAIPAATTRPASAEWAPTQPATVARLGDKRRKLRLGAVALIASVAAGMWVARQSGDTPEPEAATAARAVASDTPANSSMPQGPAAMAPTTMSAQAVAAAHAQVQQLLYDARLDLEALRLTSPAGNNALEKYREVLALAPGNDDALRGIEAIADRYVGLAYRDIERRRLAPAASYLDKAEILEPRRSSVLEARRALDAAHAAAADGRGAEFQQKFDDFVDQQKNTQRPAEPTRGTELIKRLGGGN